MIQDGVISWRQSAAFTLFPEFGIEVNKKGYEKSCSYTFRYVPTHLQAPHFGL